MAKLLSEESHTCDFRFSNTHVFNNKNDKHFLKFNFFKSSLHPHMGLKHQDSHAPPTEPVRCPIKNDKHH